MIVRFSRRSLRELSRISDDSLQRTSTRTAIKLLNRIERRCRSLADLPDRGTAFSDPKLRHLRRLNEHPYVISYESGSDGVLIVAGMHGSRDIEAELTRSAGNS